MKMTKRIFCLILAALISALALTSCGGKNDTQKDSGNVDLDSDAPSSENIITPYPYAPVSNITITLSGDSITPSEENPGIFVNGSTLTLRAGGTYTLVGDLDDGEIIVEAAKTDEVELILSGITITNTKGAPIYIKSCDKIKITLADGNVNTLTDGAKYDGSGSGTGVGAVLKVKKKGII